MSPVQLLPAAVMFLGEVVLHVGDVSESGSRGLLFHQGFESIQLQIPSRDRGDGKRKGKKNGLTAYVKFNGGGWFSSVMLQSKPGFASVFPPKRETFFGGAVNVIHSNGWKGPGKTPVMFVWGSCERGT